ncbi:hypothetical protein CBOM_00063 [Ceraceosorus bombacis]|uniref:Uncharacterized protein n=1 Tax=Ceraceosorus bombacis TaxID=401625 RepID=A0A0P1B861_9BASI|nr:hypothetical protein CBOM_00063 [Ceraceosorus bombacis]
MSDGYLSARPGFLNNKSRPGGAGTAAAAAAAAPRNFLSRFWYEEVVALDKRAGNLALAFGVGVFGAGVSIIRVFGMDLLVPVF